MNAKYFVHFVEDTTNTKRIVLKEEHGIQKPYAFITKDDEKGGYIVHNIVNGKIKHKKTYTQARRSACRAN